MGESDRYIDYKMQRHRFTLGQPDNALVWLFALNVIFYLVLATIKVAINVNDRSSDVFFEQVVTRFSLPADVTVLINRPWTLLSYMFSDVVLFRAISNMLWLWAFGSILQNLTGNKKLIPVYVYGGLLGAIFFIAATYLIPADKAAVAASNVLGANAPVMAIAVAATMVAPNYRLFRNLGAGIPLWILTAVYITVDLVGVAKEPPAQAVAHIGGAVAGSLFVMLLRSGTDISAWMNSLYTWFINLFNPNKTQQQVSVKEKVFYNTGNRSPYSKTANVTEQRVDEILDKISQKGYDHLTKEEKDILKRASEG